MNDIFGSDIMLNENMEVCLSANGELQLISNTDTVFQDIKLRLLTQAGTLFYNEDYGSNFPNFLMDDDTNENALISEVIRTVEQDPRIEPYTCKVTIIENRAGYIKINLTYNLINEDTSINQTISIDKTAWSTTNEI